MTTCIKCKREFGILEERIRYSVDDERTPNRWQFVGYICVDCQIKEEQCSTENV